MARLDRPRRRETGTIQPSSDPDRTHHIFAWKLTRTEDPFGNRIEYEYERDRVQEGPHHWDQLYLRRIRYADYDERERSVSGLGEFRIFRNAWTWILFPSTVPVSKSAPASAAPASSSAPTPIRIETIRTYDLVYLDQRPRTQSPSGPSMAFRCSPRSGLPATTTATDRNAAAP